MTTCSSILAWNIPWTEELGGLQSMGSWRVRHSLAFEHAGMNIEQNFCLQSPFLRYQHHLCPHFRSLETCHLCSANLPGCLHSCLKLHPGAPTFLLSLPVTPVSNCGFTLFSLVLITILHTMSLNSFLFPSSFFSRLWAPEKIFINFLLLLFNVVSIVPRTVPDTE